MSDLFYSDYVTNIVKCFVCCEKKHGFDVDSNGKITMQLIACCQQRGNEGNVSRFLRVMLVVVDFSDLLLLA